MEKLRYYLQIFHFELVVEIPLIDAVDHVNKLVPREDGNLSTFCSLLPYLDDLFLQLLVDQGLLLPDYFHPTPALIVGVRHLHRNLVNAGFKTMHTCVVKDGDYS